MLGCKGFKKKKEPNSEFRLTYLNRIKTNPNWATSKILCHGFLSRTYFSNLAEGTGGGDRGRLGGGVSLTSPVATGWLIKWPNDSLVGDY